MAKRRKKSKTWLKPQDRELLLAALAVLGAIGGTWVFLAWRAR